MAKKKKKSKKHSRFAKVQYLLKCLAGGSLCHLLQVLFPQFPFYWSVISVLLVFSVEHRNHLAFDRMKANLLGSTVACAVFFLPLGDFWVLMLGTILVVILGFYFKLDNAMRSGLAALVIVLVKEETENSWEAAMQRVACVVVGCIVAVIVTILFFYINKRIHRYRLRKSIGTQ